MNKFMKNDFAYNLALTIAPIIPTTIQKQANIIFQIFEILFNIILKNG